LAGEAVAGDRAGAAWRPRWTVAAFGVGLAVMVAFWARALPSVGVVEYAEGDTGTWVWMLRHGEPIYGTLDGPGMRRTNYPPLGLQLVARLSPSDGAILVTGRAVSLAAFALSLALVGLTVARAAGSRRAGWLAALALAATLTTGFFAVLCRGDALGAALGIAGVTAVAFRVRGWPIAAAALFAVSLLVKHSLVIFPAGTIAWALAREPRRGLLLAAATVALVGGAVWWLGLRDPLFGWSAAAWHGGQFLTNFWDRVVPSAIGVAVALLLLRRWPLLPEAARRRLGPWVGVLLLAIPWTLSLGRVGAFFNYLIELATAVAVLATSAAWLGVGRRAFLLHAALSSGNILFQLMNPLWIQLPRSAVEQRAAAEALAGTSGPVLSEQTWWVTATGRAPLVIPFLSKQLALSGRWDARPVVEMARRGEIERVLLAFPIEEGIGPHYWHGDRFAPGLLEAIGERYQRERRAGELYVYRPR
jgi:hypothetical protein